MLVTQRFGQPGEVENKEKNFDACLLYGPVLVAYWTEWGFDKCPQVYRGWMFLAL